MKIALKYELCKKAKNRIIDSDCESDKYYRKIAESSEQLSFIESEEIPARIQCVLGEKLVNIKYNRVNGFFQVTPYR